MSKPILHPVKKIFTGLLGALGISSLIILGVDAQQPLGNNTVAPIRPMTSNNAILSPRLASCFLVSDRVLHINFDFSVGTCY